MSGVTGRVARGAALLDQHRPGWWRQVDLARLDARRDDYLDVLSQLYGHLEAGAGALYEEATGAAWSPIPPTNQWAVDHGFDIDSPVWDVIGAYAELADQWHAEIVERRQADGGPA